MKVPYPTIPPYLRKSLKLTVLVLVAIACSAPIALAQEKDPAQIPPDLFDLYEDGEAYFLGVSDPYMEKEEAFELAKHRAIAMLALSKKCKIRNVSDRYNTDKGSKFERNTNLSVKDFKWSEKKVEVVDKHYTKYYECIVKLRYNNTKKLEAKTKRMDVKLIRYLNSLSFKDSTIQNDIIRVDLKFFDGNEKTWHDSTEYVVSWNNNEKTIINYTNSSKRNLLLTDFLYSFKGDKIQKHKSSQSPSDQEGYKEVKIPFKHTSNTSKKGLWFSLIESLISNIKKVYHNIQVVGHSYKSTGLGKPMVKYQFDSVLLATGSATLIGADLKNIRLRPGINSSSSRVQLQYDSQEFIKTFKREIKELQKEKQPSLPPILSIQNLSFSERLLEAQEKASLKITLKNTGAGKAQDVHVNLSSNIDEYLKYPSKKYFETIEKEGGKATVTIPVKAKKDVPSRKARMDIQVVEPNFHVNIQGKRLVFETQKFQAPNLVLAKFAAKESRAANPDQKIGINEQMKLKILPQNVGKQEAEDVKIQVKNDQKGVQFLGYGEGDNLSMDNPEYPSIDVGDYKKLTANYFINSRFEADSLRFSIKGEEKYGEYGFSQTKTIPINNQVKAEGTIKKVKGPEGEKGDQEVKIKDLPSFGIDIEQNIPVTSAKQPNTYALIIGNENYTKYQSSLSQESNVDFAKRDAEIFAKYVRKTLGVPSDNIRVKTNLTAATMKRQIEWLKTRAKYASDSVQLIFYYSGHGFPNPKTKEKYLMPVDVTGAQVTQGIQLGDLYDQLTQHKTKRTTLFLDACFSGAGREQGLLAAKSVKIEPKENAIMDGKLVAFSSSQGDQQSFFYKQKKHGLFTYYLLKKLKQTKGEVTYGELYNYVKNKVPFQSTEIYGAEQVPGVKFSQNVKTKWKNWILK